MKIVIVSAFFSEGMGYSENCLPTALADLGHEVHVVTSNLNVYGNDAAYEKNYEAFLGPADQGVGTFVTNGYKVHRLSSTQISGYIYIQGLYSKIKKIKPDIVQCTEIASLNTFLLAALKKPLGFRLFTETHQHMSVVKPYMKNPSGETFKRIIYRLTRTLPSFLAAQAIEKCYAIAPDCAEVARRFYGVPSAKIKLQQLGTDTILFHPSSSDDEIETCRRMRTELGYSADDIVCIYTGRFAADKNPLILAKATEDLAQQGLNFHSIFIGRGEQGEEIAGCRNCKVLPFVKHVQLADYYRLSDIGIWPTQESMSMLDAAASGLPIIVSNQIGEVDRVINNGLMYEEGNVTDLVNALISLKDKEKRQRYGSVGRDKMVNDYSWNAIAKSMERDYLEN